MYRKYDSEIYYKSEIDALIENMVENIMSYESDTYSASENNMDLNKSRYIVVRALYNYKNPYDLDGYDLNEMSTWLEEE